MSGLDGSGAISSGGSPLARDSRPSGLPILRSNRSHRPLEPVWGGEPGESRREEPWNRSAARSERRPGRWAWHGPHRRPVRHARDLHGGEGRVAVERETCATPPAATPTVPPINASRRRAGRGNGTGCGAPNRSGVSSWGSTTATAFAATGSMAVESARSPTCPTHRPPLAGVAPRLADRQHPGPRARRPDAVVPRDAHLRGDVGHGPLSPHLRPRHRGRSSRRGPRRVRAPRHGAANAPATLPAASRPVMTPR